MRKLGLLIPFAFLLACSSKPRTTVQTFTGERVYVRGDGQVKIVTRNGDGQPTTVEVDSPGWPRLDALVTVAKDIPDDMPLLVIKRVTIGGGLAEPARTEIEVHVRAKDPVIVRERVIGGEPDLVYYE